MAFSPLSLNPPSQPTDPHPQKERGRCLWSRAPRLAPRSTLSGHLCPRAQALALDQRVVPAFLCAHGVHLGRIQREDPAGPPPPAPHRVATASLLWPLSPRPPASCGRSSCFAPPPPYLRRSTCTPWRRRKKGPGRGSLKNRGDCGLAGGDTVYYWAAALSVSSQGAQRNRISGVLRHFRQRPRPLLLRPP